MVQEETTAETIQSRQLHPIQRRGFESIQTTQG